MEHLYPPKFWEASESSSDSLQKKKNCSAEINVNFTIPFSEAGISQQVSYQLIVQEFLSIPNLFQRDCAILDNKTTKQSFKCVWLSRQGSICVSILLF